MNCAQVVRSDFDTVFKVMFRTRGETQRVKIGDALARHFYHDLGIGTEFEMAVSALRYCLKIRNQYAHCVWYDDMSGKLAFVDLEELSEKNVFLTDLTGLTNFHVDAATLEAQETYFDYADHMILWVNLEGRFLAGKLANRPLAKPSQIPPPPLHSP